MACAAARCLVSRSSSSSVRCSSCCMATSPPPCFIWTWRCLGGMRGSLRGYARAAMALADHIRRTNRGMIAFDLALGTGALLAPRATLRVLGHGEPSPDAEHLFRRCAPIWLTFAAAHATAAVRDRPEDWWALAWLRATETFTDALWSRSEAFSRPGARAALVGAGVGNLAMSVAFAAQARNGR